MKPRVNYCAGCPCKTGATTPCHQALEAVTHMETAQSDKKKKDIKGCLWAIASQQHLHCFWKYAENIEEDGVPDKEICELLLIAQPELDEIYNSAIKKLIQNKEHPDVKEFIELVVAKSEMRQADNTVFLPDDYKDEVERKNTEVQEAPKVGKAGRPKKIKPEQEKKKERKFVGKTMPVHKDMRPNLYGLYSKGALERAKKKK